MEDAQVPPDRDDGKGESRRSGLRLRDTEAVAATRRDMFGDGSLLDTLASAPPSSEGTQDLSEAPPPPAEPADPPPRDIAIADDRGAPLEPGASAALGPAALADIPQSLDSIIDSFPPEPLSNHPERPDLDQSGTGFLPPPRFASLDLGLGASGAQFDRPSASAPVHMEASAILNALDTAENRPDEDPLPGAEVLGYPATDLSDDISAPAEREGQVEDLRPDSNAMPATSVRPSSAELPAVSADPAQGLLRLPLFREPAQSVSFPPFPEPPGMPPFPESPQSENHPPFPEPPGMPPFLESLRSANHPPFPEPPGMPPFLESLRSANHPPFPEPPGMPPFLESPQSENLPPFPEPPGMPPFPESPQPAAASPYPELQALPPFHEPAVLPPSPPPAFYADAKVASEATAAPMFDAAAKIAAEADATAEALENLKRWLLHSVPATEAPQQGRTPDAGHPQLNQRLDPVIYAPTTPASYLPLPVPPDQERGKGIYLLGFLTGLGLSLMAGIALYFLISTG